MMTIMNMNIIMLLIMIMVMFSHCKNANDLNDDSVDGDHG